MRIVGGKIKYVEAKREKDGFGNGFGVNVKVNDVKKNNEQLVIDYSYRADYNQGIGYLRIDGEAYIEGETKEIDDLLDEWNKNKRFNDAFSESFLSYVYYVAAANGTLVVRPLNLVPPIMRVKLQVEQQK